MERRAAFMKFLMVIIGLAFLCKMVDSNTRYSGFKKVNFQYGIVIGSNGGTRSVFDCLRTCGDFCGYVQYTNDGTCVLYSQAVLLTEPAVVEENIHGYRKVRIVLLSIKMLRD